MTQRTRETARRHLQPKVLVLSELINYIILFLSHFFLITFRYFVLVFFLIIFHALVLFHRYSSRCNLSPFLLLLLYFSVYILCVLLLLIPCPCPVPPACLILRSSS